MGRELAMTYKLVSNWLPLNKRYLKASYDMVPKGIIVHNTASAQSARDVVSQMLSNASPVSFHVAIDENEAVEAIPFSRNAWHAGDGPNGFANRNLIGIEIARSTSPQDIYLKAEDNAAAYIAEVLKQYGWGVDKLYKHKQFSATACPHRTEELGWQRFINKVQKELDNSKKQQEVKKPIPKQQPKWYQTDVDEMKALKLTTGERLEDNLKRGEAIALLNRMRKYLLSNK